MKPRKVILLSCQGIGNTVLCFPIFQYFKQKGYECDCVVSDNGASKLLKHFSLTDNIFEWKEKKSPVKNWARLRFLLNRNKYDAVYALSPSGRRENFLLHLIHASKKYGFRTNHPFRLFSFYGKEMPLWNENRHDLESNQLLAGALPEDISFSIEAIKKNCGAIRNASSKSRPLLLAIQPFTKEKKKSWGDQEYRKLLKEIEDELPVEFYLLGANADEFLLRETAKNLKSKTTLLMGKSWEEVVQVLRGVDVFIGIDSCLAHLAGFIGLPTFIFYGYTNPCRTSAIGTQTFILGSPSAGRAGFIHKPVSEKAFPLASDQASKISLSFLKAAKNETLENFALFCHAKPLSYGARLIDISEAKKSNA